jgi:hypothetical protein
MSTLTELLPYLESGHTLECDTGEKLILQGNSFVALVKPRQSYLDPKFYTLAGVKELRSIWEWGLEMSILTRMTPISKSWAKARKKGRLDRWANCPGVN